MKRNSTRYILIFSGIIILIGIVLFIFKPISLEETFETSICEDAEYSQKFISYNADGYKYSQTLTATAKICYPKTLPAYPTEGDIVKIACTGTNLYIDTDTSTCSESGCGGTKVAKTYEYVIKSGQTELKATCWTKKTDYDVNDDKIWVWVPQDIYFTFDGIKPLEIIDDPIPEPVCGDNICDAGETCPTCPKDCHDSTLTIWGSTSYICDEYVGCGDGICNATQGEECDRCWPDCGNCPEPDGGWWCGDNECSPELNETTENCPEDCVILPPPPEPEPPTPVPPEPEPPTPVPPQPNWLIIIIFIAIILILILILILLKAR